MKEQFEKWVMVASSGNADLSLNIHGQYDSPETSGFYELYKLARIDLSQALTDMAVQLANAESKCRELAAELSAVDKIHNEAVFITDEHYEQCPPEVKKMIRSLAVLQIPAYQAFLAEVRAQGVEMLISHLNEWMSGMDFTSDKRFEHSEFTQACTDFSAQLRKGAAL